MIKNGIKICDCCNTQTIKLYKHPNITDRVYEVCPECVFLGTKISSCDHCFKFTENLCRFGNEIVCLDCFMKGLEEITEEPK